MLLNNNSTVGLFDYDSSDFYTMITRLLLSGQPMLLIYSQIVDLVKDIAQRGIVILEQQINNINALKSKIADVLYRNTMAKTAWVRKLAHYVVKNISITANGQLLETISSDRLETYQQLTQKNKSTYYKMIGHCDELMTYHDKPKRSRTIYLPLIFWFNQAVSQSLPLIASTATEYIINIELRNLSDVLYTEPFAKLFNPEKTIDTDPTMGRSYLVCEYIYLSPEERQLFMHTPLEYLVREVQVNELVINAAEENNLTVGYPFANPCEYLVMLIKSAAHTDTAIRKTSADYFYGERQWDNYGLLPYYDLSLIRQAIECHYQEVVSFINRDIVIDYHYVVRLRENMMSLSLLFDICDPAIILALVIEVYQIAGLAQEISKAELLVAVGQTYLMFKAGLSRLLLGTVPNICQIIDDVYYRHTDCTINKLVWIIYAQIDRYMPYNLLNILHYVCPFVTDLYLLSVLRQITCAVEQLSAAEQQMLNSKPIIDLYYKNIIYQSGTFIPFVAVNLTAHNMAVKLNHTINTKPVDLIDYQQYLIPHPAINPLVQGHIQLNEQPIIPITSSGLFWSAVIPNWYFKMGPDTGVNVYSWSRHPLQSQPTGSINMSRIDNCQAILRLQLNGYSATITTLAITFNILRYLSGLSGKAW